MNVTISDATPINVTTTVSTGINSTVGDNSPISSSVSDASPINCSIGDNTPLNISLSVYGSSTGFSKRVELELLFKEAQNNDYAEFNYTGDQLDSIDIWKTVSKVDKLFTKALTYTGSQLTQKVVTDEVSGKTQTTTYGYSGTQLISKTRVTT